MFVWVFQRWCYRHDFSLFAWNSHKERTCNLLKIHSPRKIWSLSTLSSANVKEKLVGKQWRFEFLGYRPYTTKLTRVKLPANVGNFTRRLYIKTPNTQFTCVACSLPVNTCKFTRVYTNCFKPQLNLLDHNGYFTDIFTCGSPANLSSTRMQKLAFTGKNTCNLQAKTLELQVKILVKRWQR